MKFHVNYDPSPSPFKLDHQHKLCLLGSCFATRVGEKLKEHKFDVLVNPSGILFNPLGIATSLHRALRGARVKPEEILVRGDVYFSLQHHSSVSASSAAELIARIKEIDELTLAFIRKTKCLFITFGTAFVYFHKELAVSVGNCHKLDGRIFEKKLLEVDTIVTLYSELLDQLTILNPGLQVVFTVSPVKYLRDGLEQNSLSKATLLLAANMLAKTQTNCAYFPSYELVNDDLRDYRFYESDFAHPNALALDYIWKKFSASFFDPHTQSLNDQILKLLKVTQHRPRQTSGEEWRKQLEFEEASRNELRRLLPGIEF